MSSENHDSVSPLRDERGAVMVLGLFLALAAVAVIGALIGIGDAIIARDRAQEATDSAVFTNAVIHARGMNAIALINIVLMAFVMVYLTLSWLDLLVSSALFLIGVNNGINNCYIRYLSYAADITIPWCNVARVLERISKGLLKADKAIYDRFEKLAPPLFETQVWIAQLAPYLGTVSAADMAGEYGHLTLSFSASSFPGGGALRPLDGLNRLDKIPLFNSSPSRRPGADPANSEGDANFFQDKRIGLPVEAEAANNLCIRGARFAFDTLKGQLGKLESATGLPASNLFEGPLSRILYLQLQGVGEINKALFCTEKDADLGEALAFLKDRDFISSMFSIRGGPEKRKEALGKALKLAAPNNTAVRWLFYLGLWQWSGAKINEKFYLEPHEVWQLNWPDPHGRTAKIDQNGYYAGPKKVTAYAYNGNDWMQVWAFTPVSEPEHPLAERMVSLPSRLFNAAPGSRQLDAARPDSGMHVFIAQSEFYFDCAGYWQSSDCNKAAAATYQLRWKARLRRVHHPDVLVDLLEQFLDNGVAGTVFKRFSKSKLESLDKFLQSKTGSSWPGLQKLRERITGDIVKYTNGRLDSDTSSDAYLH